MAEKDPEDPKPIKTGLQSDGSVVCSDDPDSYFRKFMRNIDWNRPISKPNGRWMDESEIKDSYSAKWMNYELEEEYVNENDIHKTGNNLKELSMTSLIP